MLIILWLVFGAAFYLLARRITRKQSGKWTRRDRRIYLAFALLGPIALGALLAVMVSEWLESKDDKEARW